MSEKEQMPYEKQLEKALNALITELGTSPITLGYGGESSGDYHGRVVTVQWSVVPEKK